MKINKKIVFISLLIFSPAVFTIYANSGKLFGFIKNSLIYESKELIKNILIKKPYLDKDLPIKDLPTLLSSYEIKSKDSLENIEIGKMKDLNLKEDMQLSKYKLINGFYSGIANEFPGSGYIDFFEDNLIVVSSRGIIGFTPDLENDMFFTQIKNNIQNFIGIEQFSKGKWFSIKDLSIIKNKIYIAYTDEKKDDCWNTSIIRAKMNFNELKFQKFYSSKECINSKNNPDNQFNAHQSGGRIIEFDKDHIIFTLGDYRSRFLAQDINSVNGKIIKINTNNKKVDLISMGHRNPQGIFLDKDLNILLETEHGPQGGDEINLINVLDMDNKKISNYGWAISSAGEHYGGLKRKGNDVLYEKYPLYKSHEKYGFIEPLKSFVPSIGISEITKINNNRYLVSSLKAKSIYIFKLNEEKKITSLEEIKVGERIRDLIFKDKRLYLFLEDTASIGIINF